MSTHFASHPTALGGSVVHVDVVRTSLTSGHQRVFTPQSPSGVIMAGAN